MTRTLVYYPAFPHYRRRILEELNERANGQMAFMGGTAGKDSIKPLTREDINFLTELDSCQIGPFGWQRGVVRRAISSEFDVVILGPATVSISTWLILLGRKFMGRRTYLWGQCGKRGERNVKRYVQEVMNRVAHGLLVYGESEAVAATEYGTSPSKVHVVNNATHHNEDYISAELSRKIFHRLQLRISQAIEDHRLVVAYVGRLTNSKVLPVLFEAGRELHSKMNHVQIWVIGAGSAEKHLRKQFAEPYVEFIGGIYDIEALNEILEETTLIVAPYEMGLVAVDALRIGIPVLVPDNPKNGPEVEALTEGINSLRFSPGKSKAIVDAVDRWLHIAPQVTEAEYSLARDNALRKWTPSQVAVNILHAVRA